MVDVGYVWNRKLRGDVGLKKDDNNFWVGSKNLLWETRGDFNPVLETWLYNNENSEIVLEITPSYRWHFSDPAPDEEYVSYEEFMRNYQPLLFRIISVKIAKQWIRQIEELLQ